VSLRVAAAVARAAVAEGLARADASDAAAQVRSATWEPAYRVVRPLTSDGGGVAQR
jgi:malic enzyme